MMVFYFLYQWLIFMPIFLVTSILTAIITILGTWLGNGDFWGYYPGRYWSRLTCWLALCPVKVEGRENIDPNTSYIFVANHQGAFDIFLIYGFLGHNFKWMLRKGIQKIPFIGPACTSAGHIWVDERGSSGMMSTFRQALKTLKGGMSLVIFPEGTRTKTGHLNRFKKGAYQLAGMMKLPMVPLTIEGPYQILQKGSITIHPHRLKLTIHKPLPPISKEEGNEAGIARLYNDSYRIIAQSLGEYKQEEHENH
jgi:1-acyl-sn-glycerol-3-phosphate acyltransferase